MVPREEAPRRASGLPPLALVIGSVALPFVIAAGLHLIGWQPDHTASNGHLINPPLPLPAAGLKTTDGRPLATAELQGKWLLLSGKGSCDADCVRRIDEMRRIQVSLGRQMGRLRRVVATDRIADGELAAALRQQPDLVLAEAPANWLPGSGDDPGYRLHIVDPQGKLIMNYPSEVTTKGVRSDLVHLLKFSWGG